MPTEASTAPVAGSVTSITPAEVFCQSAKKARPCQRSLSRKFWFWIFMSVSSRFDFTPRG
jgi:hypothetical protein